MLVSFDYSIIQLVRFILRSRRGETIFVFNSEVQIALNPISSNIVPQMLKPNTAYRVDRTSPERSCFGQPARSDRMNMENKAKRKGVRSRRSIYSTLEP